jgi:hypothetical protein
MLGYSKIYMTYLQSSKYFAFTIIGFGVVRKKMYHKFCILHCSKKTVTLYIKTSYSKHYDLSLGSDAYVV